MRVKEKEMAPAAFQDVHRMFLRRVVWVVGQHGILQDLAWNMDQSGLKILSLRNRGWAAKGAKQVSFVGADDKRQLTVTPFLCASGELEKFVEVIWGGKTQASEPKPDVKAKFPDQFHSHSNSHLDHRGNAEASDPGFLGAGGAAKDCCIGLGPGHHTLASGVQKLPFRASTHKHKHTDTNRHRDGQTDKLGRY